LLQQIEYIYEFYEEVNSQNQFMCINEFENYKYDKDFINIKSNFDCIVNPYYYDNFIVSNILTGPIHNDMNLIFNKEFNKKHELFNKFNLQECNIHSIIKNNGKEKNRKFYEKYILNGDKNERL